MSFSEILEGLEKFFLLLLVFLFPFFFLPFSFEFFEFNKIYLLFYLTFFVLILKGLKMLVFERKIYFLKAPLDLPLLLLFFLIFISFLLSPYKSNALFGTYGKFFDSILLPLFLILLFFLVLNANLEREIFLKVFLAGSFLTLLSAYFSYFGIWQKIPYLKNADFLQLRIFNFATPSVSAFSTFLLVLICTLLGIFLSNFSLVFKILSLFYLVLCLFLYFLFGQKISYLILAFSFVFFLIFVVKNRTLKENVNLLLLPIFIFFLGILFFIFPLPPKFPQEILLPQKISYLTAFYSLIDPKNFFVGSGPASFLFEYLKEKPKQIFETNLWTIRFERSSNFISEWVVQFGILGLILLFFAFFVVFKNSFFELSREDLPYFFPICALFFSQFFCYFNSLLIFSLFLFLSLWQLCEKRVEFFERSFSAFPEANLVLSSIVLLLILFFGFFVYFGTNFYLADYYFAKAQKEQNFEKKVEFLEKAIQKNPYLSFYLTFASQTLLQKLSEELQKPQDQKNPQLIANFSAKALNWAQKAAVSFSNDPLVLENWGIVLRELSGPSQATIEAFLKELKQNPKDPLLYSELAKLYFLQSNFEAAKKYLEEGKKLKEIGEFYLYDALIEEQKGNDEKAMEILKDGLSKFPLHVELNFHLGRLYYKKEMLDEAISQWEFLTNNIFPNHSNSLYFLALSYEKKGQKEKAISLLERVLSLNPDNDLVKQKLEELKK